MSKYLLDTNAWLRIVAESAKVPIRIQKILKNTSNEIFVSHIAMWEIAIKRSMGRLGLNTHEAVDVLMTRINTEAGFSSIPISPGDIAAVQYLPWHHRDPFDRMIITQAQRRGMIIISSDQQFDAYDVKVVW